MYYDNEQPYILFLLASTKTVFPNNLVYFHLRKGIKKYNLGTLIRMYVVVTKTIAS